MIRQYPIWMDVIACIYAETKSYGIKDFGETKVKVGTSKKNSHDFGRIVVRRKEKDDGVHFVIEVDGIKIKEGVLNNGSLEIIRELKIGEVVKI